MSIGYYLSEEDLKRPEFLVKLFTEYDETLGKTLKLKVIKNDFDRGKKGVLYDVSIHPIREKPKPGSKETIMTGDNAVGIFGEDKKGRDEYAKKLIEALRTTNMQIDEEYQLWDADRVPMRRKRDADT
jgi:hypothetical protein